MSKQTLFIIYGIFSLALFLIAGYRHFSSETNLWWFACMLSGAISSIYCYFQVFKSVQEEEFVNYIVSIFLSMSFFISIGVFLWQGGKGALPIILCGINAGIWLFYSLFLRKRVS